MSSPLDVLVIGAGPVGLMLAGELLGGEVERGVELAGVEQDADRVTVRPLAVRVRDDWSPRDVAVPLMHDRGADMHRAYDAELASVYLIRPDGYLALRADWADRHALLEFLGTRLIRRSEGR
jgi:hypothetical protein